MNESKFNVQTIGNCSHPFRPASVQAHNNCVPGKGQNFGDNMVDTSIFNTRSQGVLRAPTSSWRPFGPLDFILRALRALRPYDPRHSDWIVC